jgi:hypothetical protein
VVAETSQQPRDGSCGVGLHVKVVGAHHLLESADEALDLAVGGLMVRRADAQLGCKCKRELGEQGRRKHRARVDDKDVGLR